MSSPLFLILYKESQTSILVQQGNGSDIGVVIGATVVAPLIFCTTAAIVAVALLLVVRCVCSDHTSHDQREQLCDGQYRCKSGCLLTFQGGRIKVVG